jgi:hypothetical protein
MKMPKYVYRINSRYVVRFVRKEGKYGQYVRHHVGSFSTISEAVKERDKALRKHLRDLYGKD